MISNQILQSNVDGLKEITRIDLCVCDVEGKVLASTFERAEDYESSVLAFAASPADSQVISGYQFFKVFFIIYIIGAVFYSFKKTKYMHTVFHVFVVLGDVFHMLAVWNVIS